MLGYFISRSYWVTSAAAEEVHLLFSFFHSVNNDSVGRQSKISLLYRSNIIFYAFHFKNKKSTFFVIIITKYYSHYKP